MKQDPGFNFLKDHKNDFAKKEQTRVLNPSRTNIGVISKHLLDKINQSVLSQTKLKQWKSTNDTLEWFASLKNKGKLTFLKFDVQSMYPSITETLLIDSMEFAKQYINIAEDDANIIMHSRKTFLFSNGMPWFKKTKNIPCSMWLWDARMELNYVNSLELFF